MKVRMDGWVWWSLNKGGLYVVREVYEDLNVEGNSDDARSTAGVLQ